MQVIEFVTTGERNSFRRVSCSDEPVTLVITSSAAPVTLLPSIDTATTHEAEASALDPDTAITHEAELVALDPDRRLRFHL